MTPALDQRLQTAKEIIKDAGKLALDMFERYRDNDDFISSKGPQDFVTLADKAVEKEIYTRLLAAFPEDGFLGEESGLHGNSNTVWVVDPIDGTTNFMRGFKNWAISIALVEHDEILLGLIYAPALDEFYCAHKDGEATLNDQVLRVSNTSDMTMSLINLGRSKRTSLETHFEKIAAVSNNGGDYRRIGAATLGLCDVAAARADGYFEAHINPWDIMAGALIVSSAGGKITMPPVAEYMKNGGPFLATNEHLASELSALYPTDN
ncbi:MAG: inositol monophosphatase [Alphaproteobacteria bacterium]|nr:inositol monophosphatase [Alphaproteobacteria bacterium]